MKNFLTLLCFWLAVTLSGCIAFDYKKCNKLSKGYDKLSYKEMPAMLSNNNTIHSVEGLLRMTTNENYDEQIFVVIHSLSDPQSGGVRWENAPYSRVKSTLERASEENCDVLVRMKCRAKKFTAEYCTNPLVDPIAIFNSVGHAEFISIQKVVLQPANSAYLEK